MSDATVEENVGDRKPSKLPLIVGLVLALAGGGGGFYAMQSGLLDGLTGRDADQPAATPDSPPSFVDSTPLGDVAFVEVPPALIHLGGDRHLRFRISLEVPREHQQTVSAILPRVQDVLNSYLRALDPADFQEPGALMRLRSQLLRRIKLVAGEGHVRDLLVLEFIVN